MPPDGGEAERLVLLLALIPANVDDLETDLREQLQTTLSDAYILERELGGGGMSRVFLAEERALGRRVVVKVLSPDLAAAEAQLHVDGPLPGHSRHLHTHAHRVGHSPVTRAIRVQD